MIIMSNVDGGSERAPVDSLKADALSAPPSARYAVLWVLSFLFDGVLDGVCC
jgi:hypothetical protein